MVGHEVEVEVGAVAHGGHCVARHEGQVLFVRHTLPGERVLARVTEGSVGDRFVRADAIEVRTPAAGRVPPRCPLAGPGLCGGCDWQHATLDAQRQMKADIVREQLRRLGGLDDDVTRALAVRAVPGDTQGLGWRTRVTFAVGAGAELGLRRHRSHDVVPVGSCPIAHPSVDLTGVSAQVWPGARSVEVVVPSDGGPLVVVEPAAGGRPVLPDGVRASIAVAGVGGGVEPVRGRAWVSQRVSVDGWQRTFRVTGSGFWQGHPGAAGALVAAVLGALAPRPGDQVLDLYAGVGLFAAALADRVCHPGPGSAPRGAVLAVEGDPRAVRDARRNLNDLPGVGVTRGRVDRVLAHLVSSGLSADLVVLDPPRTGAGRTVMQQICALRPRAVAYVACDPAALARDVAYAAENGYRLAALLGFDLYPMTQHVECVATLVRASS